MTTITHSSDWHDQQWWRERSAIDGTNWIRLIDTAERAIRNLRILHVGAPSS